ncbi:MAG: hypothetical protein JWP87_1061 [Labilithrix sp.]|nr:hypothetical protein [Labilithrix sp.]
MRVVLAASGFAVAFALGCSGCGGTGEASVPPPPGNEPGSDVTPGTPSPGPGSPSPSPSPSPAPTSTGTTPAPPAGPPAALSCLAQLYVGTPVASSSATAGAWSLRLPDMTELAWDDAKTKTYDDRLATPDLEDTLAMPYLLGTIKPITVVDDDPGRIRSDALLKATFGGTSAAVQAKLVSVDFVGQQVKFHTRAAAALGKVSVRLKQLIAQTPSLSVYVTGELGGTFEWRPIANTNRLSAHSYGIAIDIVVSKSNYWEWEKTANGPLVWKNQIPQAIVDAFEAEGFAWGGRWYHYDTMHFEYRPELFAAACKP